MSQTIESAIRSYVNDPENPTVNYECAKAYHSVGQSGSAVGFYLRAADRSSDRGLQYKCLLRMADCFSRQKNRDFTVKGLLQRAITVLPNRPEAYFFLSVLHEHQRKDGSWNECYTAACQGLQHINNVNPLDDVNYPGHHMLEFQKAHSAYMCGYENESKDLFLQLWARLDVPDNIRSIIRNNLIQLKGFYTPNLIYYQKGKNSLKKPLNIERNHSEAFQDLFVIHANAQKRNGTYLEIGSGHPTYGNNTYLLETEYKWTGVSLDLNETFVNEHEKTRNHFIHNTNALTCSYENLLRPLNTRFIDYLQIDCDPAEVSYQVLQNMPFDKFEFGVITFEHDHYTDPKSIVREKARELLRSRGYKLVVGNVSPDEYHRPFEDWFVHPSLFANVIDLMNISDECVSASKMFLK
jgi:hypothetical protein